jgi:hypothetical protein
VSIDPRLRAGLQRSMSKLETDPELRLPDARRRGRRRLVVRRIAVAISVVASVALVAASAAAVLGSPSRQRHGPATSPTLNSPPADPLQIGKAALGDLQQQAILGSWQSEYVCQDLVQAYENAGVGRFAPRALGELHMVKGAADRLIGDPNLCDGARRIERTHVFEPNGNVLNYQGSTVVDECTCFTLVGDHTLVNHADPGYPDISLHYEIVGDTLTFDVVVPDTCAARCMDQVQTMVGQYAVGPWHRVTNPVPIR